MDLYVGQSSLRGDFGRYARNLNFLELTADPSGMPKVAKLAAYRAQAPNCVFSVVLPPRCFSEDATESARAFDYAMSVIAALQPRWVVVRTPPAVRPGPAGLRQAEEWLKRVPVGDYRLAWEARGLWESVGRRQAAASLGVTPVLDIADAGHFGDVPLSGSCYARLLAIGTAQRPSEGLLVRFLERVLTCDDVFVVTDGAAAAPIRQTIQTLLSDFTLDEDDEDEDEAGDSEDDDEVTAEIRRFGEEE